ncbi:MAG TPA: hypothetical protein VGJ55_18590 [Pyrinomonadaceae bacterium]
MTITIEDFGVRVASVWQGLRSTTRDLVENALSSTTVGPGSRPLPYDARADWELSRLLTVLDDRATEARESLSKEQAGNLEKMADTCVRVLLDRTQSAEVFAQLVERAHARRDYKRIDALADVLAKRLAPAEICELARSGNVVIRALAHECLVAAPTSVLIGLLRDPVDASIAREVLERQAVDYGSEEARQIVNYLEQSELSGE